MSTTNSTSTSSTEGCGKSAFRFPGSAGNKLRVIPVDSPARVIEQQYSPQANGDGTDDGTYLWQIVLDRPVTGDLTLAVDFGQTFSLAGTNREAGESREKAPDSDEPGAPVPIPVLALRNISRQSGIVAVEAAPISRSALHRRIFASWTRRMSRNQTPTSLLSGSLPPTSIHDCPMD